MFFVVYLNIQGSFVAINTSLNQLWLRWHVFPYIYSLSLFLLCHFNSSVTRGAEKIQQKKKLRPETNTFPGLSHPLETEELLPETVPKVSPCTRHSPKWQERTIFSWFCLCFVFARVLSAFSLSLLSLSHWLSLFFLFADIAPSLHNMPFVLLEFCSSELLPAHGCVPLSSWHPTPSASNAWPLSLLWQPPVHSNVT